MQNKNLHKNPIIESNEDERLKNVGAKPLKYNYTYVNMEEVMRNPDEYIIPELQEACKKLWSMNIFTFMCSNRNDFGHSYIFLEKLSTENQSIFDKLRKEYPENYIYDQYRKCFGIDFNTEDLSEQKIAEKFEKAISYFKHQDIQKPFFITREQFLLECGCYSEVPNPKYVEEPGPMPTGTDLKAIDEWFDKINQPKMIKEFDESKVVKPMDEYLKEKGVTTYDPKTQRIYKSKFFLNRHLEFIKSTSCGKEKEI